MNISFYTRIERAISGQTKPYLADAKVFVRHEKYGYKY